MPVLTYKNVAINYTCQGSGPAVILIHGFLEDLSMWDSIAPVLAVKNKVVCIDLLGHGSTGNLGYVHRMEDQAEIVKEVLTELGINKYRIVGHSMGGYVGLALAKLFSEEVAGICLMNSTSYPDDHEKRVSRDRGIEAVKINHRLFVRTAIPGLFAAGNRDRFANKISEIKNVSLKMSPQGIIAALEGMKIRHDRTDVFRMGKLQKMLIIGKEDPALDHESLILQSGFEGVKTVVFNDGHMSHIENKEELILALLEFLEKSLLESING